MMIMIHDNNKEKKNKYWLNTCIIFQEKYIYSRSSIKSDSYSQFPHVVALGNPRFLPNKKHKSVSPSVIPFVKIKNQTMTIRFVLMVNKQGQTRLAQYYEYLTIEQRRALEGEIVRKCLARNEQQCSFVEHRNYKIVYRRYASLFFLVGVDNDENELAILEFIHLLVETMDRHFGNVCELDIMFHLEKAHFMLEEMVMNGCIVETNKANILAPIQLMDKAS